MSTDTHFDMNDLRRRMDGALGALKHELASLRTGRASATLLDSVTVPAYGTDTPIQQVGTVNVPEPRLITVQVWDKQLVAAIDKAVRSSGLGLNPVVDGQTLRIPIPPLNEERRAELAKLAGKYAEEARVAARNVRRHGMDALKRQEKDHEISEDKHKKLAEEVQKLTDEYVSKIDAALKAKEEEIMQV